MIETVPTTLTGLRAVIEYVAGQYTGDILDGRRHELFRDYDMSSFLMTIDEID